MYMNRLQSGTPPLTSPLSQPPQTATGSFPRVLWELTWQLPPGAPPSPPLVAYLPSPPGQPGGKWLQHRNRAQRNGSFHPGHLRQQRQRVRALRWGDALRQRTLAPCRGDSGVRHAEDTWTVCGHTGGVFRATPADVAVSGHWNDMQKQYALKKKEKKKKKKYHGTWPWLLWELVYCWPWLSTVNRQT